uniref:1,4-dihydroxy-2-naphthoate prenyltransferase n=1 Tax=Thermofilum pendens TaxID=2269 RepID=A0A7J3X733_THEPE
MSKLKMWVVATRPWSFAMTFVSITGATAYTYMRFHAFDPLYYLAVLVGVTLLHAAANVLNDYYDTVRGVDVPGAPTTLYRPHPILTGFTTPQRLRDFGLALLAGGLAIAVALATVRTLVVVLLALAGVVLLFTYSGPPGLKYRALGELGVFLSWGVFMWLGTCYVMAGELALDPVAAGAPVGMLVSAVLTANNLRDMEFDRSRGAITLAVLLGREKGLTFYAAEVFGAYAATALLVLLRVLPPYSLLVLLALPQAVGIVRRFRSSIPENADPLTAQLAQNFGMLYIAGFLLQVLLPL